MATQISSVNHDEARVIVSKLVETKSFHISKVLEETPGDKRAGFMSDYINLEIGVILEDGTTKEYRFFVKTLPRNSGQHREFVKEVQCYRKEVGFYTKILPLLLKYQKQKIRGDDVIGLWAPHCFYTRDDIIVMEDLSRAGFKMPNNRSLFDWDHCVIVMKKLASFHAASIIFEKLMEKESGTTCRISEIHPDCFITLIDKSLPGDTEKGWYAAGVKALLDIIPYLSKYKHSESLQKSIKEKIPQVCNSINDLRASTKFRNTVCHGDLWTSNILLRQGEGKKSETARFVDFQIVRYAPPVTDILTFLYTSTNKIFRDRHSDDLLKIYYETFSSELEEYGLVADELLGFVELRESYKRYLPAARTVAALYLHTTLIDEDTRRTIFSTPENYSKFFLVERWHVLKCFQTDEVFRTRFEEAMDELIDQDILSSLGI